MFRFRPWQVPLPAAIWKNTTAQETRLHVPTMSRCLNIRLPKRTEARIGETVQRKRSEHIRQYVSRSDRSTSTMCFGDQSFHQETDALSCGTGQWKTPRITFVPLKTKNRKTKIHSIMPYASPKLEMYAEIQHSVWRTIRVSVDAVL